VLLTTTLILISQRARSRQDKRAEPARPLLSENLPWACVRYFDLASHTGPACVAHTFRSRSQVQYSIDCWDWQRLRASYACKVANALYAASDDWGIDFMPFRNRFHLLQLCVRLWRWSGELVSARASFPALLSPRSWRRIVECKHGARAPVPCSRKPEANNYCTVDANDESIIFPKRMSTHIQMKQVRGPN
jgi:hypothetical protein